MVDLRAVETVPKPVTLADIKGDERFKDLPLVNNTRLSVQPVDAKSWKLICKLGGAKG